MNNNEVRILGIMLTNRTHDAIHLQEVLTKYGCSIKTRIGLHPVSENFCSPSGIVLLELTGSLEEMDKLEAEAHSIQGSVVRKMVF